jgi:predicted O-methyltransferase YrrM
MSWYDLATLILSATALALLLVLLRKVRDTHRRVWSLQDEAPRALEFLFRQLEALLALNRLLDLPKPLPPTRRWAASPDFLLVLAEHALEARPMTVVECGSGVSTVVLARCLQLNGAGHAFSLEHQQEFADKTREALRNQGLSEWATVLDAPLHLVPLRGENWPWYASEGLPKALIDLLVVDGPPMDTRPHARYPAGPMLLPRLAEQGVAFLDDASRPDEKEVLKRWVDETPGLIVSRVATEKGLARVHFSRQSGHFDPG